jgi:photosystem II stability/assembly factor-like uncharacterized protein
MRKQLRYALIGSIGLASIIGIFSLKNDKANTPGNAVTLNVHINQEKSTIKKPGKNKKHIIKGHADMFAQMHREIRTRANESAPSYPINYRFIESQKAITQLANYRTSKSSLIKTMEVNERGPANVGGRTRAIAVDPTDPNRDTWFAGAVGGGIWKTTDAGKNWVNKTAHIPNLAISSLVQAPSNPDYLWAGTGEGFYNTDAIRGDGLIASFDHGETWKQVTGTTDFGCVNRVIVDPENENIVFAAVSANFYETYSNSTNGESFGRIYKTTDGGNTWQLVYDEPWGNRIQQIINQPNNFDVQYAMINEVGVIKTVDAGENWTKVLGLSIGRRYELAIAPSNTNIVYAAIEARSENGSNLSLLYKSIDSGETWFDLSDGNEFPNWLGAQGWYDNTIAVNPYNPNDVIVGGIHLWRLTVAYGGISSIDGVNTDSFLDFLPWGGYNNSGIGTGGDFATLNGLPSPMSLTDDDYTSIELRFGSGINQKAHRFTFDGSNLQYQDYIEVPFEVWDTDNNTQLMVSFLDPNLNGAFELYEMNNEMCEFIFTHAIPYSETANGTIPDISNGMGFLYKNTFTIGPVLADGASWTPDALPESALAITYTSGGEAIPTLEQISSGYNPDSQSGTHADHHILTLVKMNETDSTFRIINGNDGGVFYSDNNATSWKNGLNGYNTSQFYGIDKKHGSDEYFGGMQDNGTWQSPGNIAAEASTDWFYKIGGDGYETSWHYTDPNLMIGGYQYNGLMRSTDGGSNWNSISGLIENGSGNAPFVTKVAKSNSDPDLIFAIGKSGIWRSDNFGENWNLIAIDEDKWGMTSLTQAEISYANPQIVWAGARMSDPSMPNASLFVSQNGGISFEPTNNYSDGTMGRVSGLATHPVDKNTAYALFSFSGAPKILRTTDLGQSWEDISGFNNLTKSSNGFPDVATYSLLVMPHNTDIIWAGTEIGLFESTNNGTTWHYAIDEFPAVSIWQMNITDDQIVMATHGRGIITVTIPELPEPPVVTLAPNMEASGFDIFNELYLIEVHLRSAYDSTYLFVNNAPYTKLAANAVAKDSIVSFSVTELTTIDLQLIAYKNGETYSSGILSETVFPLLDATTEYLNALDIDNQEFIGNGFTINSVDGFSQVALHTEHPYTDNKTLSTLLRVPIIVDDEFTTITFNEIAVIEPGEQGVNWPSSYFYDYVVVEGSKNGNQWLSIGNGYDANEYDEWLSAYNAGLSGEESMYKKRTLDLKDRFSTGDTILLRFRLYADQAINSWGWVIDSLEIQKQPIGIAEAQKGTGNLQINCYPNPGIGLTHFNYTLNQNQQVNLKVYDIRGNLVETLFSEIQNSGSHTFQWNAMHLKPGTYLYQIQAGSQHLTKKLVIIR